MSKTDDFAFKPYSRTDDVRTLDSVRVVLDLLQNEQRVEMENDEILAHQVPPRADVLRRAEALTCGPRNTTYGGPVRNMTDTARLWSAWLGHEVTAQQVAVCMVLAKIARLRQTPDHMDSHDDACAYMAMAYECAIDGKDPPVT